MTKLDSILQGKVVEVKLSEVAPDPNQPRQEFDERDMNKLKDSIEEQGILTPIVVEPKDKGKYLIVDGERRYRSAMALKIEKVSVNILNRKLSEQEKDVVRFHLQEMHTQWTIFEKAEAMDKLKKVLQVDNKDLSKRLGISLQTCNDYLSILTFSQRLRKLAVAERMPFSYLQGLARLNANMPTVIKKSVPDFLERTVKKYKEGFITNSRDLSNIYRLVQNGENHLVKKFFTDTQYTAQSALYDSEYIQEQHMTSVVNRARLLLRDIRAIDKSNLDVDEVSAKSLVALQQAISKIL